MEQYLAEHIESAIWAVFACADFYLIPNHIPAGLLMFQVPDVSSVVNSRNMIRNKVKISTRKHSPNDALYVLL